MILPMARRCPAGWQRICPACSEFADFCADIAQRRRATYPREIPALASKRAGSTSTGLPVLAVLPLIGGLLVFRGGHETKAEFAAVAREARTSGRPGVHRDDLRY
jgi:hypothetical protein